MSNANDPQAQTGNETQQEGAEAPQYVTADQIAQIVNSAVTSQLGRALKTQLSGAIEAALKPIREQAATAPKEPDAEAPSAKTNPEIAALQKKVKELTEGFALKEQEVIAERTQARQDKAFSALVQSLSGQVRPGTENTVATLLQARKQFIVAENGEPLLRVRTALFKGQAEEDHELPLKDGLAHYLKTKDAELFLPPPTGGAGGQQRASGANPGARQQPTYTTPATSNEEKARRTVEQLRALGEGFDGN